MPKSATTSPSIPQSDSPLSRAVYLSSVCRTAGLDEYDAGWIAGTLQATGADNLSPAEYTKAVNDLISDARSERITLEAEGIDPDDMQALSDHIEATGTVIQ